MGFYLFSGSILTMAMLYSYGNSFDRHLAGKSMEQTETIEKFEQFRICTQLPRIC